MQLAILSNINADSMAVRMGRDYSVYCPYGYDVWVGEALGAGSQLYQENPAACLVLLSGYGALDLDAAERAISVMAERLPLCKFYVSGLETPPHALGPVKGQGEIYAREYRWYSLLNALVERLPNVYLFDTKALFDRYGMERMQSAKMWYLAGTPYSAFGEKALLAAWKSLLRAQETTRKKCLVLDLDNTLWGGVIGEDGVGGIALSQKGEGARYRDFQRVIAQMKETGVLLAIASKNNEEDAKAAFSHPDMLLKWEDFILRKVNWSPKSRNIEEIAAELNIGLDSLVFVDDNPAERGEVSAVLPQVAVADFPGDSCLLPAFGKDLYEQYFLTLELSPEDREKHAMYAANQARNESRAAFGDVGDYLDSLHMELALRLAQPQDLGRIHQMVHKTNQFNLTTRRHDEQRLAAMIDSPNWLVIVGSLKDDFGDNGITLLLLCEVQGEKAEIESFLMSCRIMGRTAEQGAMLYLEAALKERGVTQISAQYIPTKKNIPVRDLYDELGYTLTEEDAQGTKRYVFDLNKGRDKELVCYATIV